LSWSETRALKEKKNMKKGIHPDYYECSVRCSCGNTFTTRSTKPELKIDLCNVCHPFYTGQQKFVDTGGRVQRFTDKFGSAATSVGQREAEKRAIKHAASEAAEAAAKAAREEKAAAKAAKAAQYAEKTAKKADTVSDTSDVEGTETDSLAEANNAAESSEAPVGTAATEEPDAPAVSEEDSSESTDA